MRSGDGLNLLAEAMGERGVPKYIRSDNGSEIVPRKLHVWLNALGIKTIKINPANPWQNGHLKSFYNHLRDECLDWEMLLSLTEAKVLIEEWRQFYSQPSQSVRLSKPG